MSKFKITAICLFCLIMAGVLVLGDYSTYDEYRAEHNNTQMGKDLLGETNDVTTTITETVTWIRNKLNFNIGEYFYNLWIRIKNIFIEVFDWIPGVDYDDDEDDSNDFGKGGSGFDVPETNGYGGGAGGAR